MNDLAMKAEELKNRLTKCMALEEKIMNNEAINFDKRHEACFRYADMVMALYRLEEWENENSHNKV